MRRDMIRALGIAPALLERLGLGAPLALPKNQKHALKSAKSAKTSLLLLKRANH